MATATVTATTTTTTTTTTKPKLPPLKTPVTSTFPSELSAVSARSPFPGFKDVLKQEESIKTPITPPTAYTDFLKTMLLASPTVSMTEKTSEESAPMSAPSTGSSDHSGCSCSCTSHKSPVATTPNPLTYPLSAPANGRFGRLRIPTSPVYSSVESPRSATSIRSPFSARSTRSPFDWDLQGKGRYHDFKSPKTSSRSVRQVTEVVTRTVTYTSTPRMAPAPKGKKRKVEQ